MAKPILLIDDEEKFAQMLQELLQLNGYESEYCLNPEDAVKRLKQDDFDLVITDYKMPQMDGAQFLTEARKINPDLPVIMISGLMNMPELIKVANIGVTLVLEKPFKTEDLLEQVSRFVHTNPADESTAQAMDMEVSEINFQQGNIEVTYPSPSVFISDASNENKRFLETIWNMANEYRHLPFYAQKGAEVRLVSQEIMDWTDQDPDSDVVRIDLVDTKNEFTRNWVQGSESFPAVLLVDMRDTAFNAEAAAMLADWIQFIESAGKDLSLSRLLYVLPTGSRFDPETLDLPDNCRKLLAPDCPVLLSLRERVVDTATYLTRLLSSEERSLLGKDNLLRMLHYSWPGGYQELQSRVAKVQSFLQENESLGESELLGILSERSDDPASLKGSLNLAGFLKRRQREYITLHREAGEDLKDTLLRLGVENEFLDSETVLKEKELIYPQILTV